MLIAYKLIDPTGRSSRHTSTHTDISGNIVTVINNGNIDVYIHDYNLKRAIKAFIENYSLSNITAERTKIRKTYSWNEFL